MPIRTMGVAVFILLQCGGSAADWPLKPEGANEGERSESTAKALALAATVVPVIAGFALWSPEGDESITSSQEAVAIISAGLLLGPMVGHAYVGSVEQGLKGLGIRAGILIGTIVLYESEQSSDNLISFEGLVAVAGSLAILGHAFYDIGKIRYGHSDAPRLSLGPLEATPYTALTRAEVGINLTARF